MHPRRPSIAFGTLLGLVLALSTACTFDRSVALDSGTRYSRTRWSEDPAVLWVSYQIEVLTLDERREGLRVNHEGVYYRLELDPGIHDLEVRLDYRSPTQTVRSEPVVLQIEVAADTEYRLLDLGGGFGPDRRFVPRLVPGPPEAPSPSAPAP